VFYYIQIHLPIANTVSNASQTAQCNSLLAAVFATPAADMTYSRGVSNDIWRAVHGHQHSGATFQCSCARHAHLQLHSSCTRISRRPCHWLLPHLNHQQLSTSTVTAAMHVVCGLCL
jgi:hypothetical protein